MQFISTGHNVVCMSLPLNVLQKNAECGDTGNVWMSSIAEKYTGRPKTDEYLDMCLAKFTSEYHIVLKSEQSHVIKLDNDLGYVKKRTHTDFAVQDARFSTSKIPEKYYQSILQLFFTTLFGQ